MAAAEALTLSEAGYVLEQSPAALNKAVDTGVIRARQRRVGNAVQRLIGRAEMRFLLLSERLEGDLTPSGRRRLYDAVRRLSADVHRVSLGEVILDFARIDEDLKNRLQRLETVREWVDASDDEQGPFIKGTRIPVYMVAALAREQTTAAILEDFPSLTHDQVEAAKEYAKAYPKRGRPYPARSLKRALGELADLGVFDDSGDRSEIAPRKMR
jgi:hypothetical protein